LDTLVAWDLLCFVIVSCEHFFITIILGAVALLHQAQFMGGYDGNTPDGDT
jgi:hypothetical protein